MDTVETRLLLAREDDDDDNQVSQAASSDGKRVVHEVDFFAKKSCSVEKSSIDEMKKECLHRSESELQVIQAKVQRMRAENQRLKGMLHQMNSNCYSLQIQIAILMQHQPTQKAKTFEMIDKTLGEKKDMVARQFMDLGQASSSSKDEKKHEPSQDSMGGESRECSWRSPKKIGEVGASVECTTKLIPLFDENKSGSKDNGRNGRKLAESSEEGFLQGWVHSKVPKLSTSRDVDQSVETMSMMRNARVSVRARSEAFMISDGCQWRKYGQKMANGNPCPRAYYRCTMSGGPCPVRKQIQRCAEDKTILMTTYKGHHNHPLPQAAIPMASITSAAASMMLSGTMPSADYHGCAAPLMNSNKFLARNIIPGMPTSLATSSALAPFPTITLDLTHNTSPNSSQLLRPPGQFHNPPNFSTMPAQNNVGLGQGMGNKSEFFAGLHGEKLQSPEKVTAAMAAITADPNFTAALVAAVKSIIGNGNQNSGSIVSECPQTKT